MSNRRTGSKLAYNGFPYLTSADPGTITFKPGSNATTPAKIWTEVGAASASNGQCQFTLPSGFFSNIWSVQATTWHSTAFTYAHVKDIAGNIITIQCMEGSPMLLGGIGTRAATTAVSIFLTVIGT